VYHAILPLSSLLFCRECLDVRFVALDKGNPNRVCLRIDRNAVCTKGARQRRQRGKSFVIEAHNGDGAQAACTVNPLPRRVVCDLIDLGRNIGGSEQLARAEIEESQFARSTHDKHLICSGNHRHTTRIVGGRGRPFGDNLFCLQIQLG